jgi:hypothetical protein
MHSVTAFMNHRNHIALHSNRIHENEGHSRFIEWIIVSAWRFSLAGSKIEVMHFLHGGKAFSEVRICVIETLDRFFQ